MLDTFLSDATRFLYLLHPKALGKNQTITIEMLLAGKTRTELLAAAVNKKVRELSYLPFDARFQALQQSFGLNISIPEQDLALLAHYSGVRNVAVHDQGTLELFIDDDEQVQARAKTCPRHPTPVKSSCAGSA